MRWVSILVRVIGWLLMPLVAWAASVFGAWLLLVTAGGLANPRHAVYAAFAGALVAGVVILWLWLQLLRRSPRLRHSLHVDREGLPVLDELTSEASAESPPPAAPEAP